MFKSLRTKRTIDELLLSALTSSTSVFAPSAHVTSPHHRCNMGRQKQRTD